MVYLLFEQYDDGRVRFLEVFDDEFDANWKAKLLNEERECLYDAPRAYVRALPFHTSPPDD